MTTLQTDQLPAGAQKSVGNTKHPVGVLEEGLFTEDDILTRQAGMIMRNRPGAELWNSGSQLPDEVITRVKEGMVPGPMASMNMETINLLATGQITRDQAFIGNNANFTGYYLEPGAKYVIPQMTPLRNMIPRVPGSGIDTINWRAITDYFGGAGPSVGQFILQQQGTPNKLNYNWVNLSNVFKMIAAQDIVTFEAEIYGKMFQGDVRATVAAKLIPALMQGQEICYINGAQRLWAPPPSFNVATATTGGTVAAGTNWIIATAVNANGETLASGAASPTALSIVTTGATSTVTFNIARVPGATKYNIYVGTGATQPANNAMWLQSAVTQFGGAAALNDTGGVATGYITVTATAPWAAAGTAYSTVVSAGNTAIGYKSSDANTLNLPLMFDGIQSLLYVNSATNSTVGVGGEIPVIRQPAAASGSLVLSDIDNLLEAINLNSHGDPEYLYVGIKDHRKLSNLVALGTNFRVTVSNDDIKGLSNLIAGQRVTKYINQTTGRLMDVIMLPYLSQGTIIAASYSIPFPVSAIEKPPFRIEVNREMWAVEYPPDQSHSQQWMYNAFANETMVINYLGGFGLLNGISL